MAALGCCPGGGGWPSAVYQTATRGWTNSRLAFKNKTIKSQDKPNYTNKNQKTKPRIPGVEQGSGCRNKGTGSSNFQVSRRQGRPQEGNGETGFPLKTPLCVFLTFFTTIVIYLEKNLTWWLRRTLQQINIRVFSAQDGQTPGQPCHSVIAHLPHSVKAQCWPL